MVGALTTCFSLQGKLLWNGNLPPNCNGSCQGPHQVLSEGMPDWTILSHTTFEGSGSSFTGTTKSNQGYLHGKSMENVNLEARTFWIRLLETAYCVWLIDGSVLWQASESESHFVAKQRLPLAMVLFGQASEDADMDVKDRTGSPFIIFASLWL